MLHRVFLYYHERSHSKKWAGFFKSLSSPFIYSVLNHFSRSERGNSSLFRSILIVACHIHDLTFSCKFIIRKVFIVGCLFVNQARIRKLHDTVRGCLYKLMILTGKKADARELDQSVI